MLLDASPFNLAKLVDPKGEGKRYRRVFESSQDQPAIPVVTTRSSRFTFFGVNSVVSSSFMHGVVTIGLGIRRH